MTPRSIQNLIPVNSEEREIWHRFKKAMWIQRREISGCYAAGLENERRGQQPRNGKNAALEAGKDKEGRISLTAPERSGPAHTLDCVPWFQTSGLQNYQGIHSRCFKPLKLWLFVISVTGK